MPRTLSSQVGILALGRVFAYAVMFFVPLVNVRALTVDEYGYYRQFWLLFETLTPLLILGFPRSLLYYFPRAEHPGDKPTYLAQTVTYLFAMAIVACVIYFVMSQTLGAGIGGVVKRFYGRLSLFTLFMMTTHYMDSLFVAERRVAKQSLYNVVTSVVQALTIMTVSWYTRDLDLLVYALVAFAALKFLFVMIYTTAAYRPHLRSVSMHSIREQLSYAVPLGMAAVMLLLVTQTDKFIINRFLGREAFAIYAIGAFQVPFVNIIRQSITNVTFPMMSQYQKEERYGDMLDLWKRATLKTATLFFPIFVFLEVVSRPFIVILFTDSYADAVPVFMVYLVLFLRSTVEYGAIISSFRQNRYLLQVSAAGFVINLVLSLLFYRVFGRIGVPIATVVTMYAIASAAAYKSAELLRQPLRRVLPWGGLGARFVIAVLPGVVLYFALRLIQIDTFIELAIAAAAYFLAYFAIAMITRLIVWSDLKALIGRG